MKKISSSKIPENSDTFEFLINAFEIKNHIKPLRNKKIYFKKINNFTLLKKIVKDIIKEYELYCWNNNEIKNYKGLSLTYANDLDNIYNQSLGENEKNYNYYSDSMKFYKLNRPGKIILNFFNENVKELKDMQIIRSRISILDGNMKNMNTWHRDESPYHCLRINIPIETNENYYFQIEKSPPVNLKEGYMYWFDASKIHRFFNKKTENFNRIHLILGYSPWFKYNYDENCWYLNEKNIFKNPLRIIKKDGFLGFSSTFF